MVALVYRVSASDTAATFAAHVKKMRWTFLTIASVLGMAVAHYTYRRYYPALRNRQCATPFPNPADEKGWGKIKGDEESLRAASEFELDDLDEEDGVEGEGRPLNGRR